MSLQNVRNLFCLNPAWNEEPRPKHFNPPGRHHGKWTSKVVKKKDRK